MKRWRGLVAAIGLCLPMALGIVCGPYLWVGIVSPFDGNTILTPTFSMRVGLIEDARPETFAATLNGVDVTDRFVFMGRTGNALFEPGPPLQDENEMVVSVEDSEGTLRTDGLSFRWLPPKARARRIDVAGDCIQGPLAHCRPGDWLLENDLARFVIQDAGKRDLHSVGAFGGNLIDAERVVGGVRQGKDNFFEVQPTINIETVVNAQTVEIVNDGQDGLPAVVRSCGPDDLIDYINPSAVVLNAGGIFPEGVDDLDLPTEACTDWALGLGDTWVAMDTTIFNLSEEEIGIYPGDFINGMGELEQWVSPLATNRSFGLGETIATFGNQLLAYYGFDEAEGTSYGMVTPVVVLPRPLQPLSSSSYTQTGVSFILHLHSVPSVLFFGAEPLFFLPPEGDLTFSRHFVVGDGSGADLVTASIAIEGASSGSLRGCVTGGGAALPGARVSVGVNNPTDDAQLGGPGLDVLRSHFVTDAEGCYAGRLRPGNYLMAAAKEGFPYEGGGSTPQIHPISIGAGGNLVRDFALPASGRLRALVEGSAGTPLPARLTVVGFDPSPEPLLRANVLAENDTTTAVFYDVTADRIPTGLTRTEYVGASGVLEIDLEPGEYQVALSRGGEWSLHKQLVTLTAGATTTVQATLAHVVDTTGFISSDYHVHMIDSPDSRISIRNRVLSFAGEGVDNLIATDHDAVTDVNPTIQALGLGAFLHGTIGEEITTFDTVYYNAYPQGQDLSFAQSRGSTDWGGAAPPGQDFPSQGHYILSPAEIEAAVLAKPANAARETVVQINHITSHFAPLRIDTSLEPPASQLPPLLQERFRLDPSVLNYFHHFPALEIWNGSNISHQNTFLNERLGIWMNHLNQGLRTTFIADTDTHSFHNLATAGARTWTPSSSEAPSAILDDEIGLAVKAGKAVGGQGLYVQARIVEGTAVADFSLDGTTDIVTGDGEVELQIAIQAPTWAPYDRIEIYANAATRVTGRNGGVPVWFGAVPILVLTKGAVDGPGSFTVATLPADGDARLQTQKSVPLAVGEQDTWVVVLVKGTRPVSAPMFPVYPNGVSLSENPTLEALATVGASEAGIRALGGTNALYVDADGNPGFDAPGVILTP